MSWRQIGVFTIGIMAMAILILIVFTNLNSKKKDKQPSNIETLQLSPVSNQNYQAELESIDIFVLDSDQFELIPKQIEIHGGTKAEFLTISSILKTVRANFLDHIEQVHILIEGGQEIKSIAGHIDISRPFGIW